MPGSQERDPIQDLKRLLRHVDRKLDVLIEAQGLEGRLAEREDADRDEARRTREQYGEQMSRSYPR